MPRGIPKKVVKKKSRKEHGNSTRDYDKWKLFISLIQRDVTQDSACSYIKLPISTLHDRLNRDKLLSEEYQRARQYMDVITSNVLTEAIIDKSSPIGDRAKWSLERKRRRDRRYRDKQEHTGQDGQSLINKIEVTITKE